MGRCLARLFRSTSASYLRQAQRELYRVTQRIRTVQSQIKQMKQYADQQETMAINNQKELAAAKKEGLRQTLFQPFDGMTNPYDLDESQKEQYSTAMSSAQASFANIDAMLSKSIAMIKQMRSEYENNQIEPLSRFDEQLAEMKADLEMKIQAENANEDAGKQWYAQEAQEKKPMFTGQA